jgi:hypothetical protein
MTMMMCHALTLTGPVSPGQSQERTDMKNVTVPKDRKHEVCLELKYPLSVTEHSGEDKDDQEGRPKTPQDKDRDY